MLKHLVGKICKNPSIFQSIEELEETLSPLIGRIMDQREAQMVCLLIFQKAKIDGVTNF